MVKKVKDVVPVVRPEHVRNKRFPWDAWFKQGYWVAKRGVDFVGRADTFVQTVRNRASKRGLSVKIRTSDDMAIVFVRVVGHM